MIRLVVAVLAAFLFLAQPAEAGPLAAALGALAQGAWAAITASTIAGQLIRGVIFSLLSQMLAGSQREPGIATEVTQDGGSNPMGFLLGRYATGGSFVAPPMSHGAAGNTPNAYLSYVIAVSDVQITAIDKLWLADREADVSGAVHADYGAEAVGEFAARLWMKTYDGTQTVADPGLVAKYAADPERPWTSDMIGRGVAYAILTFLYDREVYNGFPQVRFEVRGINLYDPRKDDTVGGTGTHRWSDTATWEFSENPIVMIYNLRRGIPMLDGSIYGGRAAEADLPYANWAAAMNACDAAAEIEGGGTEPAYRAGFEVRVNDEPFDIEKELLKAASAQIVEAGGTVYIRVGPVGLPVYFFTDDDLLRTRDQELDPFPGLAKTFNAVHASFPDPAQSWEATDAPPRYDATLEAEDGDWQLSADLSLPAVPFPDQVQRLMKAWIEDARRFRQHRGVFPPDMLTVDPLEAVSWTSTRNGYSAKIFEAGAMQIDPRSLAVGVALRERDATDYDWVRADTQPSDTPSTTTTPPATQVVPGFAVVATDISDGTNARQPALKISWTPTLDGVSGVAWEIRLSGDTVVQSTGSTHNFALGEVIVAEGILANTAYEVRADLITDLPHAFTAWTAVTSNDTRITTIDLSDALNQEIDDAATSSAADKAAAEAAATAAAAAQALVEGVLDLVGPVELAEPIGAWTGYSASSTTAPPKTALTTGIVTGDADFGDCYEFPDTGNKTLGQQAGFALDPAAGTALKLTVTAKVVTDGTGGTGAYKIGISTWAGVTSLENNIQLSTKTDKAVADGAFTLTVLFGLDTDVTDTDRASMGCDYLVNWTSASATADRLFPHFRQNPGSEASKFRVDLMQMQDVSAALSAKRDAASAAVSEVNSAASAVSATAQADLATAEALEAKALAVQVKYQNWGAGALSDRVCLIADTYEVMVEEAATAIYLNGAYSQTLSPGALTDVVLAQGDVLSSGGKPLGASAKNNVYGLQLGSQAHTGNLFVHHVTRNFDTYACKVVLWMSAAGKYRAKKSETQGDIDLSAESWVTVPAGVTVLTFASGTVAGATVSVETDAPALAALYFDTFAHDQAILEPLSEIIVSRDTSGQRITAGGGTLAQFGSHPAWHTTDYLTKASGSITGDGGGTSAINYANYYRRSDRFPLAQTDLTDYFIASDEGCTVTITDKNGATVATKTLTPDTDGWDELQVGNIAGTDPSISANGPFFFTGSAPFLLGVNKMQDEYWPQGYLSAAKGTGAAGGAATASAAQATIATAQATAAGVSAAAASTSELNASTSEGNALVSENAAAGSATGASGSAASAQQSSLVSAQLLGAGVALDPTLQTWSGGSPINGWQTVGEGTVTESTGNPYGSAALIETLNPPTAANPVLKINASDGDYTVFPLSNETDEMLVTLEVSLVAGTWEGAHLRVRWFQALTGSTYVDTIVYIDGMDADAITLSNTVGLKQRVSVQIKRPTGFVYVDNPRMEIRFQAASNAGIRSYTYGKFKIHSFDAAPVLAGSTAEWLSFAKATSDGLVEAGMVLRANGASIEIVGADDPVSGTKVTGIYFNADEVIASGSIKAAHIAADTITATHIVAETIDSPELANFSTSLEFFKLAEARIDAVSVGPIYEPNSAGLKWVKLVNIPDFPREAGYACSLAVSFAYEIANPPGGADYRFVMPFIRVKRDGVIISNSVYATPIIGVSSISFSNTFTWNWVDEDKSISGNVNYKFEIAVGGQTSGYILACTNRYAKARQDFK